MDYELNQNDKPKCLYQADVLTIPKGSRIFQAGDFCNQFYYLLSGSVRVDLMAKNGRAIMLYRFGAHETCILTTSCLLGGDEYCAEAHAEEDITVCTLPLSLFEQQLESSSEFRQLVFHSFSKRLASMMLKIEEVTFTPLETRLAKRIMQLCADDLIVNMTHEQLAIDLGSSREVISRKLAQWEKSGIIQRHRGSFHIVNIDQIKQMAAFEH